MSTIGLIQSLEDNPCLLNIFLKDNILDGRDEVLSRLNVSWALNKRADAGTMIVNYYNSKDPNCVACLSTDLEIEKYAMSWQLFNLICTQDSILKQLDMAAKKNFAKTVISKLKIQDSYPQAFGTYRSPGMLILSQLMIKANFQPYLDALQTNQYLFIFASTGVAKVEDYKVIEDYATKFINSKTD